VLARAHEMIVGPLPAEEADAAQSAPCEQELQLGLPLDIPQREDVT